MKYIVTKNEEGQEEIFIFPKRYHHDDMAGMVCDLKSFKNGDPRDWERHYKEPIAAGFTVGLQAACHGRSETLNLESRGRLDDMLID